MSVYQEPLFPTHPHFKLTLKHHSSPAIHKDFFKENYVSQLRTAFFQANPTRNGVLNSVQWEESSLWKIIKSGSLSFAEFRDFFNRVDANSEGEIKWEQFIKFLIESESSISYDIPQESNQIMNRIETNNIMIKQSHRDTITSILISESTNEYITLSKDSVKFWNRDTLAYTRMLELSGPFSSMCLIKEPKTLVVSKSTRKLLFFSIPTLEELPIGVCASPTPKSIRNMRIAESESNLKLLKNKIVPLYNAPTAIIEAGLGESSPYQTKIIVGDECGSIQVFLISFPQRRFGSEYSIELFASNQIHEDSINQIQELCTIKLYASCSNDGTVKFFSLQDKSIVVQRVFTETRPVKSFVFAHSQQCLAICCSNGDNYIWGSYPPHRMVKLDGNYTSSPLCAEFETNSNEKFFVTLSSFNEFFFYDQSSFALCTKYQNQDETKHSSGCMIFDNRLKNLIVGSLSPYVWKAGHVKELRSGISHKSSIVLLGYSNSFDDILTLDTIGNTKTWNYNLGTCICQKKLNTKVIKSSIIDSNGKRIFTFDSSGKLTVWNSSSCGILFEQNTGYTDLCPKMIQFTDTYRKFFALTNPAFGIDLYIERKGGMFEYERTLQGHVSEITILFYDTQFNNIISGTDHGDIMSWPLDPNGIPRHNSIEKGCSIESLAINNKILFIGDNEGMITICTLPLLDIEYSFKAHNLPIQYSVTSLTTHNGSSVLISGDSIGYVRVWEIDLKAELIISPQKIFRAHEGEITSIVFVKNGLFFASSGIDMAVRLWSTETYSQVGCFSDSSSWVLRDCSTWSNKQISDDKRISIDLNFTPKGGKLKSVRSFKNSEGLIAMLSSNRLINNSPQKPSLNESKSQESTKVDWQQMKEILKSDYQYSLIDYSDLCLSNEPESQPVQIEKQLSLYSPNDYNIDSKRRKTIEPISVKRSIFEEKLSQIKKPKLQHTFG